jgi:RNA polymerase sigma factor (TIGR02999 family)
MQPGPANITKLLIAIRDGDGEGKARLAELIYPELHRIALRNMHRERRGHTLQATALVNEAWLRLNRQDKDWKNRAHFFAVAAQIMRQILVDYARQHRADRRGGGVPAVDLDEVQELGVFRSEKMLALDEALSRLAEWEPRQSRVVELRFFGGLSEEEIADVLGISPRTVKRYWSLARAWLYAQIGK